MVAVVDVDGRAYGQCGAVALNGRARAACASGPLNTLLSSLSGTIRGGEETAELCRSGWTEQAPLGAGAGWPHCDVPTKKPTSQSTTTCKFSMPS